SGALSNSERGRERTSQPIVSAASQCAAFPNAPDVSVRYTSPACSADQSATMPRTDRPGSSQPAASTAALTAPAEVPQTIVYGFRYAGLPPSSRICRRAYSTPTWYAARAPPLIRIRPVAPRFATTLHAPSAAGIRPELAGFQCLCILACRSAAIRVGRTAGSGARVDRHERHRPARSMEEAHAIPYLREILLFLALAGVLVPLLQR